MTTKTYGTGASIPGDEVTVKAGSTVSTADAAFNAGLIGGMDTATGTATPGTVESVNTSGDADTLFGADSQLYEQCRLALLNGVDTVYAVGVAETSDTESFTATSGTLADAPVFDPRVHDEHDLTVTSGETVNIVDGTPSTPTDADTININPTTGEWEADASGTYEFNYTYGDYSTAIDNMAAFRTDDGEIPRFIGLLSSDSTYTGELLTDLNVEDDNFNFSLGMGEIPAGADAGTFSQSHNDYRMSLLGASRGYTDTGETNMVNTLGAVVGYLGGLQIGDTATYDPDDGLAGIESLHTEYTPTEAGQLIDAGVMPLLPLGGATIVKDMTTDSEEKFERIYAVEIADDVARAFHEISQTYVGELRTDENKNSYAESGLTALKSMRDGRPPLLDAYTLSVADDPNNDNGVDVEVGIDIVNVIDRIDVEIIVGDVVLNGGLA